MSLAMLFEFCAIGLLGAWLMFSMLANGLINSTIKYIVTITIAIVCLLIFGNAAEEIVHIIQAGAS